MSNYYFPGYDEQDLRQVGLIAFFEAIDFFQEEEFDNQFSTFFVHCIQAKYKTLLRNATRKKHQFLNYAVSIDQPIQDQEQLYLKDIIEDPGKNPAQQLLVKEQHEQLYLTINKCLTSSEKKIILLKLEGYSYQEIASRLDCTAKQVDNSLYSIKQKLKKKYTV